ncbi:hypothetical protein N658DRAFT_16379 [Parathielavia hyrcaniae]|uniref:Uncharacterized protein n=1 Tax=Parathielavia hyrcaniae TaxID=113614 RepID=A0AAN6Q9X8_9PEZI|nr:hypothetical protein N658DRAFT_16379 [Parathielavia hyrcaniae]
MAMLRKNLTQDATLLPPVLQPKVVCLLPRSSASSLGSYFKVYDNLIARGDVCVLQIEEPEFEHTKPISHHDILLAAEILRGNPTLTLNQASQQLGARMSVAYSARQLELAVLLSVRAMLMLDCTVPAHGWHPTEPFVDFASRCFPKDSSISTAVKEAMENTKSLKAWKLKSRCNLAFRGTDNIAHHLQLDPFHPDGPTLYLFRYTAFIKAQLDRLGVEDFNQEADMLACLKSGCLPPRLLAEMLHSIQAILFHFDDRRSGRILERLIAKNGFDEHCAKREGYKRFDDADQLEYWYWGERLAALYQFAHERPPRNKLERWMKWQTSESNAFAAALVAVLISIVVGILSLGLSGFQAWVAWKAWKDPVSNDEETTALLKEIAELLQQQRGR